MPTCPQTPGAWMKMVGFYKMLSDDDFAPEQFPMMKPIIDQVLSANYSFGKVFRLVDSSGLKDYLVLLEVLKEQHDESAVTLGPVPGSKDYKLMQVEADLHRSGYEWTHLFQTKKIPVFLTDDAIQASLGVPINKTFSNKPKTKSQLKRKGFPWSEVELRRYNDWINTSEKWEKKLFDLQGQQLYKLMQIPAKTMIAWIVDLVHTHQLSLGQAFNSGFAWYKNKVHKYNVTKRKKMEAVARVTTAEYEMFLEYKRREEADAVQQGLDESHTAKILSPETAVEGDKTKKKKHDAPAAVRKRSSKKKFKSPTEELQKSSKKKLKTLPVERQKSSPKKNKKVKSPTKKKKSAKPTQSSMRPSSNGSDSEDLELTDESTEKTTIASEADPVKEIRKIGKYVIDEALVISSPESNYEKLGSCTLSEM